MTHCLNLNHQHKNHMHHQWQLATLALAQCGKVAKTGRRILAKKNVERRGFGSTGSRSGCGLWLAGLVEFLKDKLRVEDSFIEDKLGGVDIKTHRDPRSKKTDEVFDEFETKKTVQGRFPRETLERLLK